MAEEEHAGNPWMPLVWLGVFFVVLFFVWLQTGGPSRGSFETLLVSSPLSGTYDEGGSPGERGTGGGAVSISAYGTAATSTDKEYVILTASSLNTVPVVISGWKLTSSVSGRSATIGGGIEVARLSTPQNNGVVTLAPGESAIITTGRSPVGKSFKENMCTGYFEQFQDFSPPLSEQCPYPSSELSSYQNGFLKDDQSCSQTVSSSYGCRAFTTLPGGLSQACYRFLSERLTYNGCVSAHENETGFKGGRWRIYLGLSEELWQNKNEAISLFDSSGKLVSSTSY